MNSIPWDLLDDYSFVFLVVDILKILGFIDIQTQGSGPDGGLDLLATEPLLFKFKGLTPFRWGIQCKFSSVENTKSVSDTEIRDVEGILRSRRFATECLQGYMLITNRKVSQNVVERLEGIDKTSNFRTSCIDRVKFETIIKEHQQIYDKYFGSSAVFDEIFGKPLILKEIDFYHKIPTIPISLIGHGDRKEIRVNAFLNTATNITIIPHNLMNAINRFCTGKEILTTAKEVLILYMTGIRIADTLLSCECIFSDKYSSVILGYNILQELVVLFDGQNNSLRVWYKKM